MQYKIKFKEESFAALIAFIFIKESIFKLIDIKNKYKYTNDPLLYSNEYANNQNCLKCVKLSNSNSSVYEIVFNNYTEKQVILLYK